MADYLPTTMKYFDTLLGEQLLEGEGGGGGSWQTVFEGSVTTVTEQDAPEPLSNIPNIEQITANTIKVTFNGTEYECNKNTDDSYGAVFDESIEGHDWSVYPFSIGYDPIADSMVLITESTGTYTLKIEEQQSGGSSDFSTAEVTLSATGDGSLQIASIIDNELHQSVAFFIESFEAVLYKGSQVCDISVIEGTITVSGDAVYDSDEQTITITGDCTITIS